MTHVAFVNTQWAYLLPPPEGVAGLGFVGFCGASNLLGNDGTRERKKERKEERKKEREKRKKERKKERKREKRNGKRKAERRNGRRASRTEKEKTWALLGRRWRTGREEGRKGGREEVGRSTRLMEDWVDRWNS